MTHRDRAGDAGHRQGFPTPSGGSPARPEAACQGFRAASRAARGAPHRHATHFLPKTLGSRLYGSISRTFGISGVNESGVARRGDPGGGVPRLISLQ